MLNHLGTRSRHGAAAGELYGLVKQAFLLDDSTVKERLLSLSQMGLCLLDPSGQVFSRTVVAPSPEFLEKFDAHLRDFVHLLAEVTGAPPAAQEGRSAWRAAVQRPLSLYQDHYYAAADAIFDQARLSPARRGDARRHLISSSHWNLLHGALRWHYEGDGSAGVLADRLAAGLLELTGRRYRRQRTISAT